MRKVIIPGVTKQGLKGFNGHDICSFVSHNSEAYLQFRALIDRLKLSVLIREIAGARGRKIYKLILRNRRKTICSIVFDNPQGLLMDVIYESVKLEASKLAQKLQTNLAHKAVARKLKV